MNSKNRKLLLKLQCCISRYYCNKKTSGKNLWITIV